MRITRSLIGIIAAVLVAAVPLASPAQVSVGVGVNIGTPPPALPYYSMPYAPGPNYQWQPGYWGYGAYGYYWVPGVWVAAPAVGLYWTPGYWGWGGGGYAWNAGYWGPSVGFYGGINYGFGYFGSGFVGGIWSGGVFRYNSAVVRVPGRFRNVYVNRIVIRNYYNRSRIAYNGGRGGIVARPTAAQRAAFAQRRFGLTPAQRMHEQIARQDRNMYARYNGGHPRVLAASRPFNASNRPAHFTAIHNTTVHNTTVRNTTIRNVHNTTVRNNVHNTTTMHHTTVTRPAYHPPARTYHSTSTHHSSGSYHSTSTYHSSGYHPSAARPAYHPQPASHPGGAPGGGHPPSGGNGGHPPSGGGNGGGHPPRA